ncbi:MAG TPA: Pvc16 family protein [Chthoniobacter sp.]|nr:Pvc16 family protein [Chthoniobacter sp.]
MIQELSQALRAMLKEAKRLPLAEAYISFERPGESFKPRDQSTVNLFLYDIRENTTLRSNERAVEHGNGNVTIQRAPLRVACSYLVTTWSTEAGEIGLLQEHELLGQVLEILASHETIPRRLLVGALESQAALPPLVTAMIDPQKNFSEFWTALGNRLRPSITLTATIAIPVTEPEVAPQVLSATAVFAPPLQDVAVGRARENLPTPPAGSEAQLILHTVSGRLSDALGNPLGEAAIMLPQLDRATTTNATGHFEFRGLKRGKWTARVRHGGTQRDYQIRVPCEACDLRWAQ